jgi:hypothetical protein
MAPLLWTPKEVARALDLHQSYLYEPLAAKALLSLTIGHTRHLPRRAWEAFVATCEAEQDGYAPDPIVPRSSRAIPRDCRPIRPKGAAHDHPSDE